MNNKKQNSVMWLFIQLFELFDQYERGKISRWTLGESMVTATEQAKAMHKEEVIKFAYKVLNESNDSFNGYVDEEKIYNETFKK